MHRARVARAERRIEALHPSMPSPAVGGVWYRKDADVLAYPGLPAWVCRHTDDTVHAGDGAYLCPLTTPGAPASGLTDLQAVAIARLIRERARRAVIGGDDASE